MPPEIVPQDQLRQMAQQLLDKSNHGEVLWKKIGLVKEGHNEAYAVEEGSISIRILFLEPTSDPDMYRLIFAVDDEVVATFEAIDQETYDWLTLQSLYTNAARKVKGWDKGVKDFEKLLSKEGVIGTEEEQVD